jgi:hypothetical protein
LHQLCIMPVQQLRAPPISCNKKISTVKGIQYIICCRMDTMPKKPAAQAKG